MSSQTRKDDPSVQVGDLGHASAVSFCVQIHDGGDLVAVVTDAGSHGTHVAGIAAVSEPSPGSTHTWRPPQTEPL